MTIVVLSKHAQKDFDKLPNHIMDLFDYWVRLITREGYPAMQKINGYTDHALKGNRKHQRSSSLTRRWRIIYELNESTNSITVEVLEINHHDY